MRVEQGVARISRFACDRRRGNDLDVDLTSGEGDEEQREERREPANGPIGHSGGSRNTVNPPSLRTAMCGRSRSASSSTLIIVRAIDSSTALTASTTSTFISSSSGGATYAHPGSVSKWRSS